MKKSWLITGISVLLFVGVAGIAIYYFSPAQKLQRHGYSATESTVILEKVNPETVTIILSHDHHPDFVNLVQDANFDSSKVEIYLSALEKHQLDAAETVALVNHPDYDVEHIYSLQMLNIMQSPNYLSDRRERYFAQLAEYQASDDSTTISTTQLISLVNANRDYEFYTHTQPAAVEHGPLVLVNKYYYLEPDFHPEPVTINAAYGTPGITMDITAYQQFEKLYAAALAAGFQLYVTSGYRSYEEQESVFQSWVEQVGTADAPNYAAKPGFSEHQTGYALDVFVPGSTTADFATTPAAKWLADHAPEFGFILRYPEDKVDLTGYSYEAWHLRYVGLEHAAAITEQDLSLEEYAVLNRYI